MEGQTVLINARILADGTLAFCSMLFPKPLPPAGTSKRYGGAGKRGLFKPNVESDNTQLLFLLLWVEISQ